MLATLCVAASSLFPHAVRAQDNLDPSDIWYRGFLLVQAAQGLEEQRDYLGALNKLTEAKPLYDHLANAFPGFQPEIVKERRHLIAEKRDEMKRLMRNPPPVPQPQTIPQAQPIPQNPALAGGGSAPQVHTYGARSREMEVVESDGEFALPSWDEGASQALPRVAGAPAPGMPRVQTGPSASVGAIANSLHQELSQKDSLINWLNDENLKLRRQLAQKENELKTVQDDLVKAQASRNELMSQIQAMEQNGGGLGAQQKITQLKALLRQATDQLQEATNRNEQLVSALGHSQQEMKKMRSRMAELERERDNLAEVVRGEGNGGKALKELMDRNRQLTEQLDRAEQLASSLSELNKEKDADIRMLKSEISKIKFERDRLLAENQRHQQSMEQLQRKLEALSDGLTAEEKSALASASPVEQQENELLRSIVLKQLRRQAQMKQAKELLLRQLDKVGSRSDTLLGLVEDMAKGSQLTEEEKALFRAPQFQELVDAASEDFSEETSESPAPDEANSMSATLVAAGNGPGAAGTEGPPADGVIRNQKVAVELAQLEKAARLDFNEGRYSEAEAGFLEYLRLRPRSISCLCNLGVLKIAMKNYSEAEYYLEKALAVESDSGLANYLLGRALFLQGKLDDALAKLEESLNHDPQNAKAHNSVGVISSQKGWVQRAEKAFTQAVSIDPKYGDAHFNLAVLYATRDDPNPSAAGKHYFEALHLGIPRDAAIEEFLKQAEAAGVSIGMR